MSKYTTGELAKLCGVSVRTVQYYDSRGILVPSELSEGGRRLYSEGDLRKLQVICLLREVGFSINGISSILSEKEPNKIIRLFISEREAELRAEQKETNGKLAVLEEIKRELKNLDEVSVESIGDVAYGMKNKKKLRNLRLMMILTGIPVEALEVVGIILWVTKGIWWLFAAWAVIGVVWGIWISIYYFRKVAYICPQCHEVFKPRFNEAFWAYHTPRARRLTCPKCEVKSLCVEVYDDGEKTQGVDVEGEK